MDKAEIERKFFYYLCGDKIADKMEGNVEMSYEEFDKIFYILQELQFYDLIFEMWNEYYYKFKDQINKEDGDFDIEEEVARHEVWLEEFSDNAPTDELKVILGEIFELRKYLD